MFFVFVVHPKKTIEGHKGCVFVFWGASKKNKCTRRAQGLCFFVLVLPEKTIGGHRGCVFPFLMLQKNKSNRRAQGSCFCFFLGWASKKNKSNRRAQGLCFLLLWCFHTKKSPIGGHKGYGFAFFGAAKKQTQ